MRAILLACLVLCAAAQASEARTPIGGIIVCDMRGCASQPAWAVPGPGTQHYRQGKRNRRHAKQIAKPIVARLDTGLHGTGVVDHPEGCPRRAFCGCGVAMKVFGKPVRELWLAANWFRFKAASPAAGMVAVRRHHVFFIVEVVGHGRVLAYDPNSGGHKTRIHLRSLAGYRVVDPRSS